ncbi:acetate/propionate family kinase [Actinocrispum sp. NPDC049592]|uniref:acetate/propionate family kinase n=1 Tax=Actinocrispum sp. NPDC049592 TaxID=3154835 RepID=UPI0034309876
MAVGTIILTVNPGSNSLQVHVVESGKVITAVTQEGHSADAFAKLELTGSVDAVGHRLVHGGPHLRQPTVVTDKVLSKVEEAAALAPLHVPITLKLLDMARERFPGVPHVLCPDTAFHASLGDVAITYPLPAEWRARYGLRRYGFHGLSYAWATSRAAAILDRPASEVSLLLAHLGGGCSVCAVRDGSSVDTSMGFTPLEGVPMSTRSGSVDPGMLLWLLERMSLDEVREGLYHESGLLGLSGGFSSDTRDLVREHCDLALGVFTHRVSQALAAMSVNLPRIDGLVFTGEIGWDQPEVRAAVCRGLTRLGIPAALNPNPTEDTIISSPHAPIPVLAVEPHEELEIARETAQLI